MKILGIAKASAGASAEDLAKQMNDEVKRAWELYEQDIIRETYLLQDQPGVVMIFECASLDEAKQVCATFPLVQSKLITFEFMVLGPFRAYAKLFG